MKYALLAVVLLAACSPPSAEVAKAVAETCVKQNMVARYDGPNGSVYCVAPQGAK